MSNRIRHEGIIDSIDEGCVHVRILKTSACAACKVAGYCNAAEAKEKIVDVFQTDASAMKVGDTVTVSTTGNIAAQALLWAFGFPFILMVTVLVIVLWQTGNEGMAALSGLLTLIPYYGLLFLLRHRMRRKMSFVIE
jgi:sigma-E factor negative regulatory protein RseC